MMNGITIRGNDTAATQAQKIAIQAEGAAALQLIDAVPQPKEMAQQSPRAPDPTSRIGQNINVTA